MRSLLSSTLPLLLVILAALLAVPGHALAADVPIIGVATGDATRGPLVDYIQALEGVDIRTPGYELVSPTLTARRAEAAAASPRLPETVDENALNIAVTAAARARQAEDWPEVRRALLEALAVLERDGGQRILLGTGKRWTELRVQLADAWLAEREKGRRGKRGEPRAGHRDQAAEAVRPIFERLPTYQLDSGLSSQIDADTAALVSDVAAELRRTGTVSVDSLFGGGIEVYVNGFSIGRTPLEDVRIGVGTWELQAGKPERPGRIYKLDVKPGSSSEITVNPTFEAELTTQGYAIVEAPPGKAAAPSAVSIGQSIATLTGNRYALVFAVEGANPLLLYAAMVDSVNGVVVRERTVEVEPGPVDTAELNRLLLYVVEGKEVDTSWPATRYVWIASFVASAGLLAGSTVMFLQAEDTISRAEDRDQFTSQVVELEDEAGTQRTVGWVLGGTGVAVLGLAIWLLVTDVTSEPEIGVATTTPSWMMTAGPAPDGTGGALGVQWRF